MPLLPPCFCTQARKGLRSGELVARGVDIHSPQDASKLASGFGDRRAGTKLPLVGCPKIGFLAAFSSGRGRQVGVSPGRARAWDSLQLLSPLRQAPRAKKLQDEKLLPDS